MRSGVFIFPPAPLFKELNYVFFLAHIAGSTKMFAQIKRSLPPRGRCRTNVRRKEYACIMKFSIFMPKNSFRHCFAMPPPLKGRLWKLFFSRDSSSVKLRLTPSPTGEGLQMFNFGQQFDANYIFKYTHWSNALCTPKNFPVWKANTVRPYRMTRTRFVY